MAVLFCDDDARYVNVHRQEAYRQVIEHFAYPGEADGGKGGYFEPFPGTGVVVDAKVQIYACAV
jgi:hypothetical protein